MTQESPDGTRSTAVAQLEALGLSSYAARTYVALVALGDGTAQDVSDVSDVPRTRVYDAVEELGERGLVDVQQATPKRFRPISSETTRRLFEREYSSRVDDLAAALEALEPVSRPKEQSGVWTVTGRETVAERIVEFVEGADDEVAYMTVGELLSEDVAAALRSASERGASIRLGTMSESTEADLREVVPEAELFESMWNWEDTPAGRLLMVDEERTLVSVLVDGNGDHPPEPSDETAIWGSGEVNGLVVVLRALFTWHLEGTRD